MFGQQAAGQATALGLGTHRHLREVRGVAIELGDQRQAVEPEMGIEPDRWRPLPTREQGLAVEYRPGLRQQDAEGGRSHGGGQPGDQAAPGR